MICARKFRKFALSSLGLSLTLTAAMLVTELMPESKLQLISSAEAWVGRPLTPVSVAGVARRSTRRAVAYGGAAVATTAVVAESAVAYQPAPATTSIVPSPPPNCPPEGATFVCGGYSYQPMMQGSTVVYSVHSVN